MANDRTPDGGPDPESLSLDKPFDVWRYIRDSLDWPMREKMAFWCLYSRRGTDGRDPYPGLHRLARDMGATRNTATEAVRQLQALGALVIETRVTDHGQPDSHLYRLNPPWEAQQALERRPRGMHAPQKQKVDAQKLRVDAQTLNCDAQKLTGDLSETEGSTPQKLSRNKPNTTNQEKEPKEKANVSPPAAEATEPKRRKPPSSAEKKQPDSESEATQAVVAKLHDLLQEAGMNGVEDWAGARATVRNVLRSSAGAPAIPGEEAVAALEWAWADERRRQRLSTFGLKALRSIWGDWRERDKASGTRISGGRYRDPAAAGPQYKSDSPWA